MADSSSWYLGRLCWIETSAPWEMVGPAFHVFSRSAMCNHPPGHGKGMSLGLIHRVLPDRHHQLNGKSAMRTDSDVHADSYRHCCVASWRNLNDFCTSYGRLQLRSFSTVWSYPCLGGSTCGSMTYDSATCPWESHPHLLLPQLEGGVS